MVKASTEGANYMASILFSSSYGSDDPTRATLPFLGAIAAAESGHETAIALVGEGVYLMKDYILNQVHGVGWPPLGDLMQKAMGLGIPFYI
jgi:uncharacterized protein involved in oxidation of intracellular sulfur